MNEAPLIKALVIVILVGACYLFVVGAIMRWLKRKW